MLFQARLNNQKNQRNPLFLFEIFRFLTYISDEWATYQAALYEAEQMIKRSKDKFKSNLLANADEFKKSVSNVRDGFLREGDYSYMILFY